MLNVDKMLDKVIRRFGFEAPVTIWFAEMCEQYKNKGVSEWNNEFMLATYKATMNEEWEEN